MAGVEQIVPPGIISGNYPNLDTEIKHELDGRYLVFSYSYYIGFGKGNERMDMTFRRPMIHDNIGIASGGGIKADTSFIKFKPGEDNGMSITPVKQMIIEHKGELYVSASSVTALMRLSDFKQFDVKMLREEFEITI